MMRRISQAEFAESRAEYDAAVERTPEIMPFCSASSWVLAARHHLLNADPESETGGEDSLQLPAAAIRGDTAIWRSEDRQRWLLFGRSPWGYWEPFEGAWMFACPLIGPRPTDLLEELQAQVRTDADLTPGFGIGGIQVDSQLHRALRKKAEAKEWRRYQEYAGTDCLTIPLEEGVEAWWERRSRKFRRTLRKAERDCREAGLEVEVLDVGNPAEASLSFERLLAIQPQTAKWASGTDIFQIERYREFYRALHEDLWRSGRLRLLFARREGKDVGFLFGGVFAGQFRGLQMSYTRSVAELGVGNWLQWVNLKRCAEEGVALYDLGMDAEYKRRWADQRHSNAIVFLVP